MLLRVSFGWQLLRALLFVATGGWIVAAFPKLNAGARGVMMRLVLSVWRYVLTWASVWILLWWLAPHLLVGSRAGAQTALQVLPAVMVAILVLALGSLFVIAQTAVSTWGTRTPVMLIGDQQIAGSVSRPLVLTVAALLIAGQVPDNGPPPAALTAAIAALTFAAARLILTVAALTPAILQRYTLPRAFPQHVVDPTDLGRELIAGDLRLVVLRGPLLGEMARLSIRRGDSVALHATLEAIDQFAESVIAATEDQPELRTFTTDEGNTRETWLADDLSGVLIMAADEALRANATGEDLNSVSRTLARLANRFLEADDPESTQVCIDGLAQMGTTHVQITPMATNLNSDPTPQLSWLEAEAEALGDTGTAAHALANWALCAAYPRYHLGAAEHPFQSHSVRSFGPEPPWKDALRLMLDQETEWGRRWANKIGTHMEDIVAEILRASEEHAELHHLPPPPQLLPP